MWTLSGPLRQNITTVKFIIIRTHKIISIIHLLLWLLLDYGVFYMHAPFYMFNSVQFSLVYFVSLIICSALLYKFHLMRFALKIRQGTKTFILYIYTKLRVIMRFAEWTKLEHKEINPHRTILVLEFISLAKCWSEFCCNCNVNLCMFYGIKAAIVFTIISRSCGKNALGDAASTFEYVRI